MDLEVHCPFGFDKPPKTHAGYLLVKVEKESFEEKSLNLF